MNPAKQQRLEFGPARSRRGRKGYSPESIRSFIVLDDDDLDGRRQGGAADVDQINRQAHETVADDDAERSTSDTKG